MTQVLQFIVTVHAEEMDGTPTESAEILSEIIFETLEDILPHDCSVESFSHDRNDNDRRSK